MRPTLSLLLLLGCPGKGDDSAPTDSRIDDSGQGDSVPDDSAPLEDTGEPSELRQAQAHLWADEPRHEAGRFLDVGDVDGDGERDLLLSAAWANDHLGGAWLVPGPIEGHAPLAERGFFLEGDSMSGGSGRSVSLGDVDGDGLDDVLIGAPYEGSSAAWLIPGPIGGDLLISEAGYRLAGLDNTFCGHGSDLADVSGDGRLDAVVGAYTSDGADGSGSGAIFIEFGPILGHRYLPSQADAVLVGEPEALVTGMLLTADGDLNGDGIADILVPGITAAGSSRDSHVYAVYGPVSGRRNLADELRVDSSQPNDKAGASLAMGDLDGDGLDDVVVGSYGAGDVPGAAYVLLCPLREGLRLDQAQAVISGDRPEDEGGSRVSVGQVDGQGPEDLLVGAPSFDSERGQDAGAVYLFLGPVSGSYALQDAERSFHGLAGGDTLGEGHISADLDGDGLGELILGAPLDATGAEQGGAVFVLAGAAR